MDLLDSDSETASSTEGSQPSGSDNEEESRTNAPVGRRRDLVDQMGTCIGDDVSWKGTKCTRFCALQAGTSGGEAFMGSLLGGGAI